ncbi:MAG: alpha/beta hydrolase [Chloroflexi bacterium]|nr:alpha/beta hydrolase [Chloroflexota bacterium]
MIPYTDFGGVGPELHFLHANGYPPACYLPLMELLKNRFHVSAMHLRPLWPGARPEEIGAWHPLTDDLLFFLNEQKLGPVIGIGHSLGAIVTLRAALRQPERFRALVLIDPVLFPPRFIATFNLAKVLGFASRLHPLIAGALKRRRTFDSLEQLYRGYRRRHIFRFFSDENLQTYVNGLSKPRADGAFELAYSPEWEARIYYTGVWRDMDLWWGLPKLKVPTLIIRGAETDTFLAQTAHRVEKVRPETKIVSLEKSTHLVPLEKPQETLDTIVSFLANTATL